MKISFHRNWSSEVFDGRLYLIKNFIKSTPNALRILAGKEVFILNYQNRNLNDGIFDAIKLYKNFRTRSVKSYVIFLAEGK